MKQYFKYFTLDELNAQIQSRFSGAKSKIHKINQSPQPSVDRKFYDYVTEIKSKQKQYQSILKEPTELNYLLKKTRSKINQSIDKYERNLKCKTFSDFQFHPQNSADRSLLMRKTQNLQNQHHSPQFINYHSLLQKGKVSEVLPQKVSSRSKTQSYFFNKPNEQVPQKQQERTKDQVRLRSITKVVNITISNVPQQKDKLFSFAKPNSNEKVLKQVDMHKKAIRFETSPVQMDCQDQNSNRMKSVACRTIDQICIKKIKERIKANYKGCETSSNIKLKIRDLQLIYQEESLQKIQLKQQILSSAHLMEQKAHI